MSKQKALEVLKYHQRWRKGADIPQYDIKQLTDAIQIAIDVLEQDLKASAPKQCDHYFTSEVVDGKRQWLPCEFCGKEMD